MSSFAIPRSDSHCLLNYFEASGPMLPGLVPDFHFCMVNSQVVSLPLQSVTLEVAKFCPMMAPW